MSKFRIYYLEDDARHFNVIRKIIENKINVEVFPKPEQLEMELRIVHAYLMDANKENKSALVNLFNNHRISLMVIDQDIRGRGSSGMRIYQNILRNKEAFKSVKVIFFSGSNEDQDYPKRFQPQNVQIIDKDVKNLSASAETLARLIKRMLNVGDFSISEKIKRLRDDTALGFD